MPKHGSKSAEIDHIYHYTHHVSDIFPDDTNKTVTLTAGAVVNTFGAWAPIVDNLAVEFSTVFAAVVGHISAISVEDATIKDERYLLEISYGADRVIIARTRFMKVNIKVDVNHKVMIRSEHIHAGETVYYRMKCETALATAEVHFRYYMV